MKHKKRSDIEQTGVCFFQAEDGIRDLVRSRGLGDVYKRQVVSLPSGVFKPYAGVSTAILFFTKTNSGGTDQVLSLIHI